MNYLIANWKMNMSFGQVNAWLNEFITKSWEQETKIIIAPSQVHVPFVSMFFQDKPQFANKVFVASQDVSVETKGAHTGEVGGFQLAEFCNYCIVGHSERKETPEIVLKKLENCLDAGITPIVCFTNVEQAKRYYRDNILLAWEDPSNISVNGVYREKDDSALLTGIEDICNQIPCKNNLIYGGSVNGQNMPKLAKIANLSGVLVGNASLRVSDFYEIYRH